MAKASFNRAERIGHRGIPRLWMENTLRGFELAVENGAEAIELDVHCTSDGEVVVHHDPVVEGMPIIATPWQTLSEIRLTHSDRIPRLADVFRAVGSRVTVYVELKGQDVERAAIDVGRKAGGRFAVHSFDHAAVGRAASYAPDVQRGVLLDKGTPNVIDTMKQAIRRVGARDVWPHRSLVNDSFVRAAHEIGARVIVWTVNEAAEARRLESLKVDGICGDDVRILVNPG